MNNYNEVVIQDRIIYYFRDGISHRTDGPALICFNKDGTVSSEYYRLNSVNHRTDGPAVIHYYLNRFISSEFYYLNGKYHRTDGPACIYYRSNGDIETKYYYLHDIRLRKNLFNQRVKALCKTIMK